MNSIFTISKTTIDSIMIIGNEKDNNEYLVDQSIIETRAYTFLQSATLNYIYSLDSNEIHTYVNYNIVTHDTSNVEDKSLFTFPKDGLYKIYHSIIPTKDWFDYVLETNSSAFNNYSLIYYYNVLTNKFYKYSNNVSTVIDVKEILESNLDLSTVVSADILTFSTAVLKTCLYNVSKELLSNEVKTSCKKSSNSLLYTNRDILWMATNVIKYLLEINNLYEALRILERVQTCSNVCNVSYTNTNGGNNCGCNT